MDKSIEMVTPTNKMANVLIGLVLALSTVSAAVLDTTSVESSKVSETHMHHSGSTTLAPSKTIEVQSSKESIVTTATPILVTVAPDVDDGGSSVAPSVSKVIVEVSTTALPVISTAKHDVHLANSPTTSKPYKIDESPVPKFCAYIEPICNSSDKISPKQIVKIQAQFKQMIHLTSGKLSTCFLTHYMFDPATKPLSRVDLVTICLSKDLAASHKGSARAFEQCAARHWDPSVDRELDKIIAERANCIKNHNHTVSVNSTQNVADNLGDLSHDDGDLSLINEIVRKMLDEDKNLNGSNTDIKMIDVSSTFLGTTQKPASPVPIHSISKHQLASTVAPLTKSDLAPAADDAAQTSPAPVSKISTPHPSVKPIVLGKQSTDAPSAGDGDGGKVGEEKVKQVESGTLESKIVPKSSTTSAKPTIVPVAKPVGPSLLSKNKVQITTVKENTTAMPAKTAKAIAPVSSKPLNPLDALDVVLKRQEKEKQEFEARLKAERDSIMKQLQKKQDENEAKDAIKALQVQRDASAAPSNGQAINKLHQMEHERQMAMDPIGHTLKHQQYEMSKQQRNG